MTTPHKWADVIKAWADGKPIEFKRDGWVEWKSYTIPEKHISGPWDYSAFQWRIKPETVRSRRYIRELRNGFGCQAQKEVLILSGHSSATARDIEKLSGFIRWIDDDWQEIDV